MMILFMFQSEMLLNKFLLVLLSIATCALLSSNSNVSTFIHEAFFGPSDLTRDTPPARMWKEYDFVIVGAGAAGAVLGSRLSEVPEWRVLLIEAGQDENTFTDVPFMSPILSATGYSWGYRAQPQDNACLGLKDRRSKWPKGRGMGGSSIINGMIYNRGHPRDYDNWESAGNPGWGWNNVLPYFLKSENAKGDFANSSFHGRVGYLDVQRVPYKTVLAETFLAAGRELGQRQVDYNSGDMLGISLLQVIKLSYAC
jgi:choline dehydrogenase-like flavoprotein